MECKNNVVIHVIGYGLGALLLATRLAVNYCVVATPLGILGSRLNPREVAQASPLLPLRTRLAATFYKWLGTARISETPRLYKAALQRASRLVPLVSLNYTVLARNTILLHYAVCPSQPPLNGGIERLYTCACGQSIIYGVTRPREDCSCTPTEACVTENDMLVIIEPPRSAYIVPPRTETLSSIDEFLEEQWGSVLTRLSTGKASDPRSVAIPR